MEKILTAIANNLTKIVVGIAFTALIIGQVGSCGNTAKLNQKLGVLQESMKNTSAEVSRLTKVNAEVREQNERILKENEALKKTSDATNIAMKEGLARIKALQAARPEVPPGCEPIVAAMQAEIDEWTKQFSLAIKDRDDWKAIAENFNLAYINQIKISDNLQTSLDLVSSDSVLKDEIIKELRSQLAKNQLSKNLLKGGVIAILATVVIASLIK